MSHITKFVLLFICASSVIAAEHPAIMVSIKPFYNICAKVMHSIGEPKLLLKNNSSPHEYQLKPSDISLIQSSDLIIWGGPSLDGYLQKSVVNYPGKDLDLAGITGLNLLPLREVDHNHDHDNHHGHDHANQHYDPHFWLDPNNAVLIAEAIATRLAEIDPTHKKIYLKNAHDFKAEITTKTKAWRQDLAKVTDDSFIVFHDAYQYFEKYFKLHSAGAISINPEIPLSAKRVQEIQSMLKEEQVRCIFSEPQFNPKIIATIAEDMHIYQGQLDPLGQDNDLGPNGYVILIDKLANNFVVCTKFK